MPWQENIGPCECCVNSGTGTGTGDLDCPTGWCTWEWNGTVWVQVENMCAANGTPVPGDPGCTYSGCICLSPIHPGDFVGQMSITCCSCSVVCL